MVCAPPQPYKGFVFIGTMEFNFNGYMAYVIQDTEEGCYIFNNHGFVMEAEQMLKLAKRLRETANAKGIKNNLVEHNRKRKIDFEKELGAYMSETKKPMPKPKEKAFVYLFECGGKYKVGYTKDVDRRVADLDHRPFPVNVIAVSKATSEALDIEQSLHTNLGKSRIGGEWYELSQAEVEKLKKCIEEIT